MDQPRHPVPVPCYLAGSAAWLNRCTGMSSDSYTNANFHFKAYRQLLTVTRGSCDIPLVLFREWPPQAVNASGGQASSGEIFHRLLHVLVDPFEKPFLVALCKQVQQVLVFLNQDVDAGVGNFQIEDAHP